MVDKEGRKTISIKVSEQEYKRFRDAALDQRYMNFSQFVRDAIEEKILRFIESR